MNEMMRGLEQLITFLRHTMSMSEIYQPAIILHLLKRDGTASKSELAKVLIECDESVQDFYEKKLMRWPKNTLTKHEVVRYDSRSQIFKLNYELDPKHLLEEAKLICEEKISDWIEKNKSLAEKSLQPSKRYRVLQAAKGKCELCGISSKVAPIDVDHIVPRSKADARGYVYWEGNKILLDDVQNLQALCYRCNRAKRDSDTTDFRMPDKKLVRDLIPDIIKKDGREAVTKRIAGSRLKDALLEKLTEEHAELIFNQCIDEIADMIEVLISLSRELGHSEQETLNYVWQKRRNSGGFEEGIFLLDIAE